MSNFNKVKEFHLAFGLPVERLPKVPDRQRVNLRWKLINEEHAEVSEEFQWAMRSTNGSARPEAREAEVVKRLAKELADVLYVTYGAALEFGIDLDAVFAEVHSSNMSKLGEDGKPIYRHDGKVMKGQNYHEADLDLALGLLEVEGEEL